MTKDMEKLFKEELPEEIQALAIDFNYLLENMTDIHNTIVDELYVISLDHLSLIDLDRLNTLIKRGDSNELVMYFNYQDFATLYQVDIKESLEDDREFPTIFQFTFNNISLNYIRATEDSEHYKKGFLYVVSLGESIDGYDKSFWILPFNNGTDDGNINMGESASSIRKSFPVIFKDL